MIIRILTAIISVIGGIYGYKSLIDFSLNQAKQFVLASSINAGIFVITAAVLSINKQKFIKGNRGFIQLFIASFLTVLIFVLIILLYVVTNQEYLFLLLLFMFSQLFFVVNFRRGVFNQYKNIDLYWRIQFLASITRLALLLLLNYFFFVSAINLVVIYVIITFQVAWLNTNGKLLSEINYIFSSAMFHWDKIFRSVIINKTYLKVVNGIFRSNRTFMETGLIPIYASLFLVESKSSTILLFAPFISATNNLFRTVFYKIDLMYKLSNKTHVFIFSLFVLLCFDNRISKLFSGISFSYFFEKSLENDLIQTVFLYFLLLIPTLGYAKIEIMDSRSLFLFYKIFIVLLCFSLLFLKWVNVEYEFYFYIVPLIISFTLLALSKSRFT